jgi:hypothetical protein
LLDPTASIIGGPAGSGYMTLVVSSGRWLVSHGVAEGRTNAEVALLLRTAAVAALFELDVAIA